MCLALYEALTLKKEKTKAPDFKAQVVWYCKALVFRIKMCLSDCAIVFMLSLDNVLVVSIRNIFLMLCVLDFLMQCSLFRKGGQVLFSREDDF